MLFFVQRVFFALNKIMHGYYFNVQKRKEKGEGGNTDILEYDNRHITGIVITVIEPILKLSTPLLSSLQSKSHNNTTETKYVYHTF